MKKKALNIIIVILTIGMVYEIYSYFNMKTNNKVLEDIKTVDILDNKNKTISIMVQNGEEGDFEYYPEKGTTWPDYTKYTYVGTKCTDDAGTNVEDTKQYVQFDEVNNEATITTKKTIYCTLYFGKGRPALEVLDAQGGQYYGGGKQGSRTAVEGLYRFKGTKAQVTNNFVCIGGPLNPDTCGSAESNEYLYRIIGVTDGTEASDLGLEAGMLKVIKVIPTSTRQAWASNRSTDIDWDNGNNTVRVSINGSGFYNGLEQGIKNIIPAVKWWKGDRTNAESSGAETKTATTGQYQIGLMYAGDYYNSWGYGSNTNSWLHITNTMSGKTSTYSSTYEWTMTRFGLFSGGYNAWFVATSGNFARNPVNDTPAVRPVFYLPSTTGLVGNGTESSPYVITSLSNS